MSSSNCHTAKQKFKPDLITYGSLTIIAAAILAHSLNAPIPGIENFTTSIIELLFTMSWGLALGLASVGIMNQIPREYFTHIMGKGDTIGDIIKAAVAGVILDVCNHGILLVSAKLYERGLSLAQVMTFLIASPWNSLSLTFIVISLIGLKWTLVFTATSMLIAIISGMIYLKLVKNAALPQNPNTPQNHEKFDLITDAKQRLKSWKPSTKWFATICKDGWADSKMIIRWVLFGAIIATAMRTYIPTEIFAQWLGPTATGLAMTLLIATIIEVCSEGSAPIAAEIMNTGNAPGNGFAFLMAGVATDYTEILVVKEFTKSWRIALTIPLITVPQIVVLGLIFNHLHG